MAAASAAALSLVLSESRLPLLTLLPNGGAACGALAGATDDS